MSFNPSGVTASTPTKRSPDPSLLHRLEKRHVLSGLHRYLRIKDEVARKLREPFHQRESLGSDLLQLAEPVRVLAAPRHPEVFERHRIEVVISQRDEAKPHPAEFYDLLDHGLDTALTRFLAVGAPDGTEGTVFWTPAHRLDRGPRIAFSGSRSHRAFLKLDAPICPAS